MNAADITRLIAVAISRDGRELTQSDMTAWSEAAERVRWEFDEAREAILAFYAETPGSVYIRAGDISTRILAKRHQARPPSATPVREVLTDRNPDELISTEADKAIDVFHITQAGAKLSAAAQDALVLIEHELTTEQRRIDMLAYSALDGGKLTAEAALSYFASKRALYVLHRKLLQKAKQGESAAHRVNKALEADNG